MYRVKQPTRRLTHASKLQCTSWGDIRHDQITQQANRDRYTRNSVYRLKYKRVLLVFALKLNSATKPVDCTCYGDACPLLRDSG